MDSTPEVSPSTLQLNIASLQNIFGNDSKISTNEAGKYYASTKLADGITHGGQQMDCQLHREMVAINVDGTSHMVVAWVLDNLQVNNETMISGQEIKILISDDPYYNEKFQATMANLELQSLYVANTDHPQIYVQSQINSMDSIIGLKHEITHFETINEFTPQQVESMKKYGNFKFQIDLLLFEHIEKTGIIPDINECEELRRTFSKDLIKKITDAEIDELKHGAQLIFLNEIKTNQRTSDIISGRLESLFPSDPEGYRFQKYFTVMNLSYARSINGIFGTGTVDSSLSELR